MFSFLLRVWFRHSSHLFVPSRLYLALCDDAVGGLLHIPIALLKQGLVFVGDFFALERPSDQRIYFSHGKTRTGQKTYWLFWVFVRVFRVGPWLMFFCFFNLRTSNTTLFKVPLHARDKGDQLSNN